MNVIFNHIAACNKLPFLVTN